MKEAPQSLLDTDRLDNIVRLLNIANKLDGSIAEVGVYRGGSAYYLDLLSNGKNVYLCDTFEGIPYKGELDKHEIGDFDAVSYEDIRERFPSAIILKGIFPDTAEIAINENQTFCFVHLDADQYKSTVDSLNYFYPKMVEGGVIIFDDWGWLPGVDLAITEFFKDKPEEISQEVDMQCYIIKK